jgi:hypothetical protein
MVPALSLMAMAYLRRAVSLGLVLLSQGRPTRGRIGIGGVSDLTDRSRSLRDFRRDGNARGRKHGRRATARGPSPTRHHGGVISFGATGVATLTLLDRSASFVDAGAPISFCDATLASQATSGCNFSSLRKSGILEAN